MLPGLKYRNDFDILVPDPNGNFEILKIIYMDGDYFTNLLIDHVEVIGNRGGTVRKAWVIDYNRLSFRNTHPCKKYKYKQGVLKYDTNGPQRVRGYYPFYMDLNRRRVFLMPDRSFSTVPMDYVFCVQAAAKDKVRRVLEKKSRKMFMVHCEIMRGTTRYKWWITDTDGAKRQYGQGKSERDCRQQGNEWIKAYKKRMKELGDRYLTDWGNGE